MTLKAIQDPVVTETIEHAVSQACAHLDLTFPGFENGGISSNFQGVLISCIESMLLGRDPRGKGTFLNQLAFDEQYFGNPSVKSDMFAIVRKSDQRVYSIYGKFVQSPNSEEFDEFVSYDYAYNELVKYLGSKDCQETPEELCIMPVYMTDFGYTLDATESVKVPA